MPVYEYVAEQCRREPPCSRRKEYLQPMTEPALTSCRDCGAPIRRIMSAFAARSGSVGASSPDPTPLNITGMPAPSGMADGSGGEGSCGHNH
jgi:putative FmdB family regulatory protein